MSHAKKERVKKKVKSMAHTQESKQLIEIVHVEAQILYY